MERLFEKTDLWKGNLKRILAVLYCLWMTEKEKKSYNSFPVACLYTFHVNVQFLNSLKESENRRFSDVFGCRNGAWTKMG